jgi:hypothetical protein
MNLFHFSVLAFFRDIRVFRGQLSCIFSYLPAFGGGNCAVGVEAGVKV